MGAFSRTYQWRPAKSWTWFRPRCWRGCLTRACATRLSRTRQWPRASAISSRRCRPGKARPAPIYPCHVSPRDMRQHPIGTGPFKFVEFKPNEMIKSCRKPDYWKSGRPYLDGIEYTIIPNRSTAILAFIAGKFDLTFPYEVTVPLIKDIKQQAPQVVCERA